MENDSEGSLKDFVVHSSEESESASGSEDGKSDSSVVSIRSDSSVKQAKKRLTRASKQGQNLPTCTTRCILQHAQRKINNCFRSLELGLPDEVLDVDDIDSTEQVVWWKSMISEEEMQDYKMGPKIVLLFAILRQCESIGDKVYVVAFPYNPVKYISLSNIIHFMITVQYSVSLFHLQT